MRVLVVEDVASLADDIAEGLRDNGFAKLDTYAYQAVVLDRDLPGIHGDALCRMITEADKPSMVLMLTAASAAEDRISGLGRGADDYLAKPFHFTEPVLRIRALARRQPAARSRILQAVGVELDPQRHTAARDGRPLDLSAKEFAVLEALMRASPAFLTAEDLLEQAPSATASGSPNRLLCSDPVRHMSVIGRPAEHATVNCGNLRRRLERVVDAGPIGLSCRSARHKRTQHRAVRNAADG